MSALKAEKQIPDQDQQGQLKGMAQAAERYKKAMQDQKSRDLWIEDYLPLVKSIVSRMRNYFPESYDTEDMYGIGARALVVAVNRFDPSKGKSFGSYATLRIKGALLDELRKIDCLPRSNRAKARSLQTTILNFETKYRRSPTVDEIQKELGITQPEYEKLLQQTQPVTFVPIDGGFSDSNGPTDEGLSLSETLSDPTQATAQEVTEKREKIIILRDLIKDLPDQNKKILMLYYFEELKLSEIAQIFSLTEGRISQILSHSILCLRSNFRTLESN